MPLVDGVAGEREHRGHDRLEPERAALDERAIQAVHERRRRVLQRHARSPARAGAPRSGPPPRRWRARAPGRTRPCVSNACAVVSPMATTTWQPREGLPANGVDERRRRALDWPGPPHRARRGPSRAGFSAAGRGTMRYASTASTRAPAAAQLVHERRPSSGRGQHQNPAARPDVARAPASPTRRPPRASRPSRAMGHTQGDPAPSPWRVRPPPFGRRPARAACHGSSPESLNRPRAGTDDPVVGRPIVPQRGGAAPGRQEARAISTGQDTGSRPSALRARVSGPASVSARVTRHAPRDGSSDAVPTAAESVPARKPFCDRPSFGGIILTAGSPGFCPESSPVCELWHPRATGLGLLSDVRNGAQARPVSQASAPAGVVTRRRITPTRRGSSARKTCAPD